MVFAKHAAGTRYLSDRGELSRRFCVVAVLTYAAMDALRVACSMCAAIAGTCWLLSVVTREYSWTDRVWSIAPVLYVGWFALHAELPPRLVIMAVLVALWGGRLTFNFARKGGYARGGEDYRWAVLRERMPPAAFAAFNLAFIAGYQNLLLLLISLPAWVAARHPATPLGVLDLVATLGFVLLLVGETVADEQQWRFQQAKRDRIARGGLSAPSFVTTGLFRYSRHPNFVCEQGMWWMIGLFAVASSGEWLGIAMLGPVLLTLLFLGSTRFTEAITLARYPEYADYQRRTSMLLPWPPRG
jgi:steroid 5-alpha reductase family enzyme